MSRFPESHPIEVVRGARRPDRAAILRAIAHRCAWLQGRIASKVAAGMSRVDDRSPEMHEIRALAACAEIVESFVDPHEDVADALADATLGDDDEPVTGAA